MSKPKFDKGTKFDDGKTRWHLMPWGPLEEVMAVLEHGVETYGEDNWKSVTDFRTRYTEATLRHAIAYLTGEDTDPDSGLHHMAHVATNAIFLVHGGDNA